MTRLRHLYRHIALFLLIQLAWAYIPAAPSNSTENTNSTDISTIKLQWMNNGSYSDHVSYQLMGNGSSGVSKGALVHFSEDTVNSSTVPTTTPWIAFVSCDKNNTNSSLEQSIFDLAQSKGAVSALLYSLSSQTCIISPGYSNSSTFDHVFDVFTTKRSASSRLIESQFGQLSGSNVLNAYNSKALNDLATDVARSIEEGDPVSAGFLLATLQAATNVTPSTTTSASGNTSTTPNTSSNSVTMARISASKALLIVTMLSFCGRYAL